MECGRAATTRVTHCVVPIDVKADELLNVRRGRSAKEFTFDKLSFWLIKSYLKHVWRRRGSEESRWHKRQVIV